VDEAPLLPKAGNGSPGEVRPETNHDQKIVIQITLRRSAQQEARWLDISFKRATEGKSGDVKQTRHS